MMDLSYRIIMSTSTMDISTHTASEEAAAMLYFPLEISGTMEIKTIVMKDIIRSHNILI